MGVVQRLVALGADLEARDAEGRVPLHLAAGCGDRAMVAALASLCADVNSADAVGGGGLPGPAALVPCDRLQGLGGIPVCSHCQARVKFWVLSFEAYSLQAGRRQELACDILVDVS